MEIRIGNRTAEISLVSKVGNKVQVMIDDKCYDVDVVMAENGSCSILHEGLSYDAQLIREEGGKRYDVTMADRSYQVDIIDTQAKYLRMKHGGEERQEDQITAPMPGKVVKIMARKGDQLAAGDIVLVIEAMKMQSNFKVSADCTVESVLVQEGESVNAGQVLVKLQLTDKQEK